MCIYKHTIANLIIISKINNLDSFIKAIERIDGGCGPCVFSFLEDIRESLDKKDFRQILILILYK